MQAGIEQLQLKNIIPFYQPIISADTLSVYGYEVLGRIKLNGKIFSLGPFFHNELVTDEEKLEVDTYLQNLVFDQMLLEKSQNLFFLNIQANYLIEEKGSIFIKRLESYQKKGLKLNQLVLEMTEHDFTGNLKELLQRLEYLKSLGIKIALDDVGTGSSNLNRVGIMEPDILKVDIHSLKNYEETISYYGVLYSLSLLARKIGADLLFEAIENKEQLYISWRNNARFFQGYFLSKPDEHLLTSDLFKEKLIQDIPEFIQLEKEKLVEEMILANELNDKLEYMIQLISTMADLDAVLVKLSKQLRQIGYRMYITDENGFQLTANLVYNGNEWVAVHEFKGLNWSWRPYFLENIIKMEQDSKGILSDIYSDIETGELIRTFSFPISRSCFLFLDIPVMNFDSLDRRHR